MSVAPDAIDMSLRDVAVPSDAVGLPDVIVPTDVVEVTDAIVRLDAGECAPEGVECAAPVFGAFGRCGGFVSTCDETGAESRLATGSICQSGMCVAQTSSESRSCSRRTDGITCGRVSFDRWSLCGEFTSTCDMTGTQTRSVATPICGGGGCDSIMGSESRVCTRTTEGSACGSTTASVWSACGGFASDCGNTGTRTRNVFTSVCGGGVCSTLTSIETSACSRATDGDSCDSLETCQRGTCVGGRCNLVGNTCNSPLVCCEPGLCIPSGSPCP